MVRINIHESPLVLFGITGQHKQKCPESPASTIPDLPVVPMEILVTIKLAVQLEALVSMNHYADHSARKKVVLENYFSPLLFFATA